MLQSIELTNFKSFRHGRLPLSSFTIVLGANGAGKSNLFDALRLLRFLATGTSVRDALEGHATPDPTGVTVPGIRGGAQSIPHFASDTSTFRISVEMRVPSDTISYQIEIDAGRYRVVNEVLSSKRHPGSYVFTTEGDPPASPPDLDAPAITAQYYTNAPGRNPRRDFSPSSSILSQFEGRRAHSNQNEDIAEMARAELDAIRPLELQPEVLRRYSPLSVFELGEHGENFAAIVWLLTAWADRQPMPEEDEPPASRAAREQVNAIKGWLSELSPREVTDIAVVRAPTGEALFAVSESPFEQPVTARSLSDGTLRFAALAFALLGPGPLGPGQEVQRTLLIEELENGINPFRLQLLVRMVEAAVQSHPALTQVIATTHSPSLLNWASERTIEDVVVIGWDAEDKCSRPVRLRNLPEFEDIKNRTSVGELQTEGWIELAADKP